MLAALALVLSGSASFALPAEDRSDTDLETYTEDVSGNQSDATEDDGGAEAGQGASGADEARSGGEGATEDDAPGEDATDDDGGEAGADASGADEVRSVDEESGDDDGSDTRDDDSATEASEEPGFGVMQAAATLNTFEQRHQGGDWTSGETGTYNEGDWVDQRAELTFPGDAQSATFTIQFGYQRGTAIGYDAVQAHFVGDGNENQLDSYSVELIEFSHPDPVNDAGNPGVSGEATFRITPTISSMQPHNVWLYYQAHLATPADGRQGAGGWQGSSLHVTGAGGPQLPIDVGPAVALEDLTVDKTAEASFDRDYTWTIDKTVDGDDSVTVPEGTETVDFDYEVVVTPSEPIESNFVISGEITVTNPNDVDFAGVNVSDIVVLETGTGPPLNVVCTVPDGANVTVPANDTAVVDYVCEWPGAPVQPDWDWTNTATATWDEDAYFGTSGVARSPGVDVDFAEAEVTVTNETVTLTDSDYEFEDAPVVLNAADGEQTFEYSIDWDLDEATPGACTEFTNTANIVNDEDVDHDSSATVEVCVQVDLEVDKTAHSTFDRLYEWDIDKSVDETRVVVADGEATFDYTVVATPVEFHDSNWTVEGQITVTNPNAWDAEVTVTDEVDIGGDAVCVVADGEEATIGANETVVFDYECTFDGVPVYEGTVAGENTATVAWGDDEFTGTADIGFWVDPTDRTVEVWDDQTDPANPVLLGEAEWNYVQEPVEFPYSLTHEGVPGECVEFTNNAWIETDGDNPEDSTTVTVCVEDDLTIAKTVEASFDRLYEWDVEKSVSTDGEVDADGKATFDYTVAAIPGDFVDSNWQMSGSITVHNPNTFEEGAITVEVTDEADVGGGVVCTVEDGTEVEVGPGATETFAYECEFTEQPEYEGTNTATVSWTNADGDQASVATDQEVVFELDGETDLVVEVWDDMTDPDNPVSLGEATWNAEGTATEFTYALDHQGVDGETAQFTNTAWIETEGDNPEDSTTVEVILDGPPEAKPADPEPEADPKAPALPVTGTSITGLVILALLLLLTGGGVALATTRRRAER